MFNGLTSLLFGNQDQKKKQQQPVQVQQAPRPLAFNGGNINSPVQVRRAAPAPAQQQGPSLQDVARFFVGGTAKTANTALGGIALAGNALSAGTDKLFGGQHQQFYNQEAQNINNTFLKPNAGLLGQGGFMDQHQFATAAPQTALIKGAGAGAQTASEVYAPARGASLGFKTGRAVADKALQGMIEGSIAGTAGSAGSQLADTGHIDPIEALKSGLVSGTIGGVLPVAAHGTKAAGSAYVNAADKLVNRETPTLPAARAAESGTAKVPQGNPNTLPQRVWPVAKMAGNYKNAGNFIKAFDQKLETARRSDPGTYDELVRLRDDIGDMSSFHALAKASPKVSDIPVKGPRPKITKYVAVNTLDNNSKPTYDLVPLDNKKHTVSNGMVTDKKGKPVGSYLGVDDAGNQYAYVEGKPVNIGAITGNLDQWGNVNKSSWDMNRLIEANAPNAKQARTVQGFTTIYKDKQEAAMKTDLKLKRGELSQVEKKITAELPKGIKKDELSKDLFRAAEGKADINQLRQRYGADFIDKHFLPTLQWSRKTYDDMLTRTNNVLQRNGYDPIPKRGNYITHIQDDPGFWEKVGMGIRDINPLGSSISSDVNPGTTRAGIPDEIVGNTATTNARRKYNPFAQQRKGESSNQDFFAAHDAYYEPMLFNQHMTPAASRARVVERAFRTNDKAKDLQLQEMADIMGLDEAKKQQNRQRNHQNYDAGRRSPFVMAWQEYGNQLAGKTNAWDRTLIDSGGAGAQKLMDTSTKLQGIAGASTIPGSTTAALAQVLSLPQTVARDSTKSVLLAAKDMMQYAGKGSKDDPMRQSAFMRARYTDAASKRVSAVRSYTHAVSKPMEAIERETGELSWRSAYREALGRGETGQTAIDSADLAAKKTLAGRGIGDRPLAFNSKAAGIVTQFGLEVNNMRVQFFHDFSAAQKAKFLVAAAALNYVYNATTGNSPLPDYIGSGVQSAQDFMNSNDDKKDTPVDNAVQAGQRLLGETSKFVPGASTLASTVMSDTQRQQVFGKNGDLSRYGTPPLASPVTNAIAAGTNVVKGDLAAAGTSLLKLLPTGNQISRTTQGAEAAAQGFQTKPDGKVTSVVNQNDPLQWAQALTFGKNTLPQQQQALDGGFALSDKESERFKRLYGQDKQAALDYFQKTIKRKIDDSNRSGSLTNTGQTPSANAASAATSAQDLLDNNKKRADDLKNSLSAEDYALTQLSKADRTKLIKAGTVTQAKLDGLDAYVKNKKQALGYPDDKAKPLPPNLNKSATKLLDDYNHLQDDAAKKAWGKTATTDPQVLQSLSAWSGGKAKLDSVSNDVAKEWAQYQSDLAEGKVNKLTANKTKTAILKKAFTSQLDDTEQQISGLSKAELAGYLQDGTITEQNVANVLTAEKAQFDAGLISREGLASKLGLSSRSRTTSGTKTSTGGKGKGRGRTGSTAAAAKAFKLPGAGAHKARLKGASIARNAGLKK